MSRLIGDRPLTNAERVARHREAQLAREAKLRRALIEVSEARTLRQVRAIAMAALERESRHSQD